MSVRVYSRMSPERVRLFVKMLLPDARIVHGKFAVTTEHNGRAATLIGGCRGDALTDRPEGCEAIAATIIVIPHVGVPLPPGTSVEHFLSAAGSFFAGDDVAEAVRKIGEQR